MNKTLFVGIVIVVFIIGFAAGMVYEIFLIDNNDNNGSSKYIDDFIGAWEATEQAQNESHSGTLYYTWSFYENQTAHFETRFINETKDETIDTWQAFEVTENKLKFDLSHGGTLEYSYNFSENKEELTLLTEVASMTFHKK